MSKMNTAADRDRRQLIGATRGRDLYWGFTIAVFGNYLPFISFPKEETYLS